MGPGALTKLRGVSGVGECCSRRKRLNMPTSAVKWLLNWAIIQEECQDGVYKEQMVSQMVSLVSAVPLNGSTVRECISLREHSSWFSLNERHCSLGAVRPRTSFCGHLERSWAGQNDPKPPATLDERTHSGEVPEQKKNLLCFSCSSQVASICRRLHSHTLEERSVDSK